MASLRRKDIRSLPPAEAINFFVEQRLEQQLMEEIQQLEDQPETPRDTVMALPPLQK